MKLSLKLLVVLGFLIFLGGCASGPKYNEVSSSFNQQSPDKGRIYFYRDSAFGFAIQPKVKLNGTVVGKSTPKGFFFVDSEPGNYEVMTSTEVDRKLSLTLAAGQVRYVKLNISMGFFAGHVYPELVESKVGMEEIKECSYIGES